MVLLTLGVGYDVCMINSRPGASLPAYIRVREEDIHNVPVLMLFMGSGVPEYVLTITASNCHKL